MESSTTSTNIINRRWTLCIFTSFLGLFFLFLFRNQQGWPEGTLLESLQDLQATAARSFSSRKNNTGMVWSRQHFNAESGPPATLSTFPPLSPQTKVLEVVTPLQEEFEEEATVHSGGASGEETSAAKKCNIFEGKWVYDPQTYPLYQATQCPYLSHQVTCRKNGRPDSDYEHWRWQPTGCQIPRFNGTYMLEILRGKRVAFVGDSINRNMWESMSCLLYSSIPASRATVDVSRSDYMAFRAKDYDCLVEFYWSPLIVPMDKISTGQTVLRLDRMPDTAERWRKADVLVFNTGHWWTHTGHLRKWDAFERAGKVVEEMERDTAFKRALRTWARWVEKKVDHSKTSVFFRSISPEHKRENLQWCYNQSSPITNEPYIQWFPKSMIGVVEKTVADMQSPVSYLNITHLSEYRRDAHTGIYTVRAGKLLTKEEQQRPEQYADCSHWCLPGLPDTWNMLLYAILLEKSQKIL